MTCAQIKEQLIDYLYGELPTETRAAFVEHLNGCPACKSEVASFERTLGSTRIALGGQLLEEPPARVHLAVLEAAKAAAKATAPRPRDELGFFSRLWRTPWFLPAFGAASVAAAVFLVRVLKNPEVLPGQRPHSVEERSLLAPEPVSARVPTPTAQPAAAAPSGSQVKAEENLDEAKASGSASGENKRTTKKALVRARAAASNEIAQPQVSGEVQGLGGLGLSKGRSGGGTPSRFAEPPPPRQAGSKSNKSLDDLLGEVREKESPQRRTQYLLAPAGAKADKAASDEDRLDGLSGSATTPAKKAARAEPAAEMAKPTAHAAARSASAPAGALSPYPAESAANQVAPAAPASVRLRQREEKQAEVVSEDSAEADRMVVAKDKKGDKKAGEKAASPFEESVRKAERLYASQDWNAAAAAYRDLLNRFPGQKDAPKWRERMNEANAAYQRTLEAKRKKAVSDDPLSGSKK